MFRRVNLYPISIAFGLSVLLILAGTRYTDNSIYHPSAENRRNVRNFLKVNDGEDIQEINPNNFQDGIPDIDLILEKTRLNIKLELSTYNFTYSGVSKLEDLILESGGRPIRSVIVSTWRSGTTFLGEVLNSLPGNYYHYEPLLKYGIIQIRGPPESPKAMKFIEKMLRCDHTDMDDYFLFGSTHQYQYGHNTRLWDHCKLKKALCNDAEFTSKFCRLFPFQSMKVVRIRLGLIEEYLKKEDLNLKVVLLVRDPRAVMQSRQHRDFCLPAPDCWNPALLCDDMINDYVAAARLQREYPGRLLVIRYEELALNPNATIPELFKFLRLDMMPTVKEFLQTHTNIYAAGVSSTFRVSKEVPFKWKSVFKFNYVEEIQEACAEAMELWGYRKTENETQMTSKDFNPIMPYTVSV